MMYHGEINYYLSADETHDYLPEVTTLWQDIKAFFTERGKPHA